MTAEADDTYMRLALQEADAAAARDEVPVGALIVVGGSVVTARASNRCEELRDPTAHAEILAIRAACGAAGVQRLDDSTLYCTLEPCAMCAGAILHARVERVVFGAWDSKFGAAGSIVDLLGGDGTGAKRFNHRCVVAGGILLEECAGRLRSFFRMKRLAAIDASGSLSAPKRPGPPSGGSRSAPSEA